MPKLLLISVVLAMLHCISVAGQPTNRAELQNANDERPKNIAGIPKNKSEQTIEFLPNDSKFKVPMDLSERELRQAISTMTRGIWIAP